MAAWFDDWRLAWQGWRRHPVLVAAAVLSLGLAIGATTAVFSIWRAVLRYQVPVQDPNRLVAVYTLAPGIPGTGYLPLSHLDYLDYARQPGVFRGSYALLQTPVALGRRGAVSQVVADVVSGSYFDVLGVRAALGSVFHASQTGADGSGALAVLGHDFFERRFGGNSAIIGRTITLNGAPFTVTGVAPAAFAGTQELQAPDLWAPLSMHRALLPGAMGLDYNARNAQFFSVVARLLPGVSVEQANAAVQVTAARLARQYPKDDQPLTATVLPLRAAGISPNQRPTYQMAFILLLLVVGMVLLIACGNVANLLLGRAQARQPEMALRMALGAGRGRLLRQLLTESLQLGLLAGLAGLLLALVAQELLWAHRPVALRSIAVHPGLNGAVLWFSLAMALLTALLFGLAPALRSARVPPARTLRAATGAAQGGRWRAGGLLLAAEVGFSIAALVVAGLFLASLRRLNRADPGFDAAHLATLRFDLASTGLDLRAPGAPAGLLAFERNLLGHVRGLPGVTSATLASGTPMAASAVARGYRLAGRARSGHVGLRVAAVESIAPDSFFRTMGIPLLAGRDILPTDTAAAPRVMIVNRTFARQAWPGRDPVGQLIYFHRETRPTEVVGVAADSVVGSLSEGPVALAYLPLAQEPATALGLAVRTARPSAVVQEMRQAVEAANPQLAITQLEPAGEAIHRSLWAARMGATLLLLLAALATVLTAIGIYGVAAYSVRRRWRELGIRMALGARRGDVLALVLRDAIGPVLAGLILGIAGALALGRLAASLLFGMAHADPAIIAGYSALFLAVAALALLLPARQATGADPATIFKDAT